MIFLFFFFFFYCLNIFQSLIVLPFKRNSFPITKDFSFIQYFTQKSNIIKIRYYILILNNAIFYSILEKTHYTNYYYYLNL